MKVYTQKIKSLTMLFLILVSTAVAFLTLPRVSAATQILTITPTTGAVGSVIYLTANITTVDGPFEAQFDKVVQLTGNATGNKVGINMTVPPATAGPHNVTILDATTLENDTRIFTVISTYNVTIPPIALPEQRQEGASVPVTLNITGGDQTKTYGANVTIRDPSNSNRTGTFNMTTDATGTASLTVDYASNFPNANTSYVGTYTVFSNTSIADVNATFTIGLTNSTLYHRSDGVDIKALYTPSENVTITISSNDLSFVANATADSITGIVEYSAFSIPSNASLGTYTVNVTSSSGTTKKTPPDVQNFTISGYDVNITARNLAREPVPGVIIGAYENSITFDASATTDLNGNVTLKLEPGFYYFNATYNSRLVGENSTELNGPIAIDMICNLTNLQITVVDEDGLFIPGVQIAVSPLDQSLTSDINGTTVARSLLGGLTYTLNASRYGTQFASKTVAIITDLSTAYDNVSVTVPKKTLQILVLDGSQHPISNAIVEATESLGIYYQAETSTEGTAIIQCTLGQYTVSASTRGVELNRTHVNLNETVVNVTIVCNLYGLDISVRVVDYFGQPISNANVTIERSGLEESTTTGPDGQAVFQDTLGGNLQVAVYLQGSDLPSLAKTYYAANSSTIQIQIGHLVSIAGYLVDTTVLITIIIIVLIVLAVLAFELVKRRRRADVKKSAD